MSKFLKKPQIKNVLLGVLAIVIGALFSSLGSWDNLNNLFWTKLIVAIILTIIYCILLIYYSTSEINDRRIKKMLEDQIKAFESVMVGIVSICKESATDVNTLIHDIIDKGIVDLKIWNFDKTCTWICARIYTLLCNLVNNSKDFAVAYVRLIEDKKPEDEIKMTAFANQNMHRPSIYGKSRRFDINDDRSYHDVDLFRLNKSDIEIIIGSDKINEVFSYNNKDSRSKNKKKYNQYIAIPVFCNDRKMIGLLEIICLNDTSLGETEKEINEIISKYIVPYSYLILIMHKLEKALLAKPLKAEEI